MIELLDRAHRAVTLASLALTPATIIAAAVVVFLWWGSAKRAFWISHKSEVQWFVLGVTIGFIGSMVDNIYWGLAWAADYTGHESRDALFRYGVYSNTPFRQICTIGAAVCHIKAAVDTDSHLFRYSILGSLGISVLALVLLVWLA